MVASKKNRARKSYEDRTGLSTRAVKILIAAIHTKPATVENAEGNVMRVWKSSEMSSYTNVDVTSCLADRVAVEPAEMLGTVPPSAVNTRSPKAGCSRTRARRSTACPSRARSSWTSR
jgi:hypothetical protein